jgi:hypothetical protein
MIWWGVERVIGRQEPQQQLPINDQAVSSKEFQRLQHVNQADTLRIEQLETCSHRAVQPGT